MDLNQNAVTTVSQARETDLSFLFRKAGEWIDKYVAKYGGNLHTGIFRYISFFAVNEIYSSEHQNETDYIKFKSQMEQIPAALGGCITKETQEAFRELAKKVRDNFQPMLAQDGYSKFDISGVQNVKQQTVSNLGVCEKTGNGAPCFTMHNISYSFSRADFEEMYIQTNLDYMDDYEKDDDEEAEERLLDEARNIDLSEFLRISLGIWGMRQLVKELPENNIAALYTRRLYDYTQKCKYHAAIQDLPVMLEIRDECAIDANRKSSVATTFIPKMKVNMVNLPNAGVKNPNKPSKTTQKKINAMPDSNDPEVTSKFRKTRTTELYHLLTYLQTGEVGDDTDQNLRNYKHTISYDDLGKIFSRLPWKTCEQTVYMVQKEQVELKPDTRPAEYHNKFRISETKPKGPCVAVTFRMWETTYTESSAMVRSGVVVSHDKQLPCAASVIYRPGEGEIGEDRAITCIPVISSNARSKKYFEDLFAEKAIAYDILMAGLMTAYYQGCTQGIQYILNNRMTLHAADQDAEMIQKAGTDRWITASGYALEQIVASGKRFLTQGMTYENSNKHYAANNAASSLLSGIPYNLSGENSFLRNVNSTGIVYITTFRSDRQKKYSMQVVCSESYEITANRVTRMGNTTEVRVRDRAYRYDEPRAAYEVMKRMQENGVNLILLVLSSPSDYDTKYEEDEVIGLSCDNIDYMQAALKKDAEESGITPAILMPLTVSMASVKYISAKSKSLGLRDMQHEVQGDTKIIPLFAFLTGNKFSGYKTGDNRSCAIYKTRRDYYKGEAGQVIASFFGSQGTGRTEVNGIYGNIPERMFDTLYFLHEITNEKNNAAYDEGRLNIFDRLKNDLINRSVVKYDTSTPGTDEKRNGVKKIHYLALMSKLYDAVTQQEDEENT